MSNLFHIHYLLRQVLVTIIILIFKRWKCKSHCDYYNQQEARASLYLCQTPNTNLLKTVYKDSLSLGYLWKFISRLVALWHKQRMRSDLQFLKPKHHCLFIFCLKLVCPSRRADWKKILFTTKFSISWIGFTIHNVNRTAFDREYASRYQN